MRAASAERLKRCLLERWAQAKFDAVKLSVGSSRADELVRRIALLVRRASLLVRRMSLLVRRWCGAHRC